jgi:hypothetical protein
VVSHISREPSEIWGTRKFGLGAETKILDRLWGRNPKSVVETESALAAVRNYAGLQTGDNGLGNQAFDRAA